jgi:hypothetical protein
VATEGVLDSGSDSIAGTVSRGNRWWSRCGAGIATFFFRGSFVWLAPFVIEIGIDGETNRVCDARDPGGDQRGCSHGLPVVPCLRTPPIDAGFWGTALASRRPRRPSAAEPPSSVHFCMPGLLGPGDATASATWRQGALVFRYLCLWPPPPDVMCRHCRWRICLLCFFSFSPALHLLFSCSLPLAPTVERGHGSGKGGKGGKARDGRRRVR